MASVSADDRRPVIVGVGRSMWRGGRKPKIDSIVPLNKFVAGSLQKAADDAAVGTGNGAGGILSHVQGIACPGRVFELMTKVPGYEIKGVTAAYEKKLNLWPNFPGSVAKAAGCSGVKRDHLYDTGCSGSTPQYLLNMLAEKIAQGELDCAAVAGGDYIETMRTTWGKWKHFGKWADDGGGGSPVIIKEGIMRDFSTHEYAHNLGVPATLYPLYEQAMRREAGTSREEHFRVLREFTSGLSRVAENQAKTGLSLPIKAMTPEELQTSESNRWISYPYNKWMVANPNADMSASVILMSAGKARSLGIPEDRWVWVDGCGDATEIAFGTERKEMHRSYALEFALRSALRQAGLGEDLKEAAKDVGVMELYACFPVSIRMAAKALGVMDAPAERLSQIGGLMFHGGPGANTAANGLAALVQRLRDEPAGTRGLIYANGGLMTKHSIGVFSTRPSSHPPGPWHREPTAENIRRVAEVGKVEVAAAPEGEGVVETYTVVYPQANAGDRRGAEFAVVLGTLVSGNDKGKRFVATTELGTPAVVHAEKEDILGARVLVNTNPSGKVLWRPAAAPRAHL
eukprot:Hpha_TRINITY_DN16183_c1_g7::TRINITY_DN16183_c1_g7_i1::g.9016::m.9016/K00626/E2.3.1.9, atoB; acetyl-CoA C-acetyltransferase